jgi:dUTPase
VPTLTQQFVDDLTKLNPGQPVRWSLVGVGDHDKEDPNKGVFIQLAPHCDIMIPSYIMTKFPSNIALRICNKGSIATKKKLVVGAEIVDSIYQGIIMIHLINTSNVNQFIEFGAKMCQAMPIVIDDTEFVTFYSDKVEQFKEYKNVISVEEFFPVPTERKDGAFGSTGTE